MALYATHDTKKATSLKAAASIDTKYFQHAKLKLLLSFFFFLMGQPRPLFVYFPFSHQVESNSDRTDPSRPLYPLDHNHGPKLLLSLLIVISEVRSHYIL